MAMALASDCQNSRRKLRRSHFPLRANPRMGQPALANGISPGARPLPSKRIRPGRELSGIGPGLPVLTYGNHSRQRTLPAIHCSQSIGGGLFSFAVLGLLAADGAMPGGHGKRLCAHRLWLVRCGCRRRRRVGARVCDCRAAVRAVVSGRGTLFLSVRRAQREKPGKNSSEFSMNTAEKIAAELRGSKVMAARAVTVAKPNPWAGSANGDAEKQRVAGIVQRLRTWSEMPTLPLSKIVELTGLSRARIVQLVELGTLQRKSSEIIFASVLQHFANRVSKLSAAGKSRSKSKSGKAAGR